MFIALFFIEKVVKANKQFQVKLQIKITWNYEKEAAIWAACEAESRKKMQEIESNYAAEQAENQIYKSMIATRQTELNNL